MSFHHEGNIFMIKKLNYCMTLRKHNSTSNIVPLIGDKLGNHESVGVGLFENSSLMEIYPLPSPHIPCEPWYCTNSATTLRGS